jgi:2-polyprenyl-3-methyl-5-hydroxy-6-metoxy-1,4-benzoquinol methylase
MRDSEGTLSWSVAGAEATGVDISEEQIEPARQKAEAAGLSTQFVTADVYALPAELQRGDFDIVYTSTGVMVWLPDLAQWATTIAAALRPGGTFILYRN